ncbi:class I SAM-dependent methyltransferase [Maribacter algarum]|nr:class I SAM-dependent methyltransferase [Maribacter algarum]
MSVLLKKPLFEDISQQELSQQIESKKKCKKKLPTWYKTPGIYYPKKINIEQTSSEIAAQYKSGIIAGKSLLDLTGGLGVDSYYFSKKIAAVFHCEINKNLQEITAHNFHMLGAKNIQTFAINGLDFIKNSKKNFDWLFLDPSRRNDSNGKVFQLSDCEPNILENLELLYSKSENILLKTSPLLDISIGLKELSGVKEIHVIAINNDVKELLWVMKKGFLGGIKIRTCNFTNSRVQNFDFELTEEKTAQPDFALPLSYLYEPNASVLKAGAFKCIGFKCNLKKLNPNTHLYTSSRLIDFPGRRFKLLKLVAYGKKNVKNLNLTKANITTRNFPESVDGIRKKFKIKEGGSSFLFFFKDMDNTSQVALCDKV